MVFELHGIRLVSWVTCGLVDCGIWVHNVSLHLLCSDAPFQFFIMAFNVSVSTIY